jgi:hypothetical protein
MIKSDWYAVPMSIASASAMVVFVLILVGAWYKQHNGSLLFYLMMKPAWTTAPAIANPA